MLTLLLPVQPAFWGIFDPLVRLAHGVCTQIFVTARFSSDIVDYFELWNISAILTDIRHIMSSPGQRRRNCGLSYSLRTLQG